MRRRICSVYRSSKDEEMFLIVDKARALKDVPEALFERFGKAHHSMSLLIDENRKLARFSAEQVLNAIEDRGYFLQLPPPKDETMAKIARLNTKIY